MRAGRALARPALPIPRMWRFATRPGSAAASDRHQVQVLVAALHGLLAHRADPAHVVLGVDDARLQRRPLLRLQERAVLAEDPEVVLGVALVELLLAGLSDLGMRGHEDAGPRAVLAGLPGPRGIRQAAVLVEGTGGLAVVEDVAATVLRVPVRGLLRQLAMQVEPVADHPGRH